MRAIGRWSGALAAATFAYIMADPEYYEHVEDLLTPQAGVVFLRLKSSGCILHARP